MCFLIKINFYAKIWGVDSALNESQSPTAAIADLSEQRYNLSRLMTKQQNECAPSLIRVFATCTQWVVKDPSFLHANSEDWSDWEDAQAELSLRWAHSPFVGFVMRRLILFQHFIHSVAMATKQTRKWNKIYMLGAGLLKKKKKIQIGTAVFKMLYYSILPLYLSKWSLKLSLQQRQ